MLMWPFKAESESERVAKLRERIVALETDFSGLVRKFEDLEDAWATFRGRRTKTAALDARPVAEQPAERLQREILERRARLTGDNRGLHAGG